MNYIESHKDDAGNGNPMCGEFFEFTEESFLPPHDDRLYASGIDDIEGGDNFSEYAEYFWEAYEDDIYDGESL